MVFEIHQHEMTKYLLRRSGQSLTSIADQLNISPSFVTRVSQGHAKNARVQQSIATAIGQKPQDIWPERYPSKQEKTNVES